jgi:integrase
VARRANIVELPAARRPHAVVWTSNRVEHWRRTGERPVVAVWTATQTAEFLHQIRDHRLYAAYHLIALRGLRRGEAAGLRWCDLDLDGGAAVISQQLQQYNGLVVSCRPKTRHSARVIALDRTTITALRQHRARQEAERAAAGDSYHDSGYVFTSLVGDPMAPDRLTRIFQQLCRAADMPPIRLHDLRHGAATLALAAGVELKVVQDMEPGGFVFFVDVLVQRGAELVGAAGFAGCGDGLQADEAGGVLFVFDKGEDPALAWVVLRDERPGHHSR